MVKEGLTRAQVLARLGAAAPAGVRRAPGARAGVRGDHDLNPEYPPDRLLVDAAVLVPIIERAGGLSVLLTVRSAQLTDHAGQVAFPGGRIEPDDGDPFVTAVREAREEVSLNPACVEIVGRLDTYLTRTGYRIVPVVGLVDGHVVPAADPVEVAEIFEVPLDFLIDPAHHERRSRVVGGRTRQFYALTYGRHVIWGATAGMIVNLSEILTARAPGLGDE